MNTRIRLAAAGTALLVLAAAAAHAQGVSYAVVDGPYADAELHRVNLETGHLTPVGMVGHTVTHIAFDSTGTLFGVDDQNDKLLRIDFMRGTGSTIGPLGVEIDFVAGIAFDDDDRLWMTARGSTLGPSLYEVDRATGSASWVAGIPEQVIGSLAARGGTMFMASYTLAEINTTNGMVEPRPSSSFGVFWARAVDFDNLGRLWGLMLCGPCMTPFDILLMRQIDTKTGIMASTGAGEPHGTWGLAILRDGVFIDGFETGDITSWPDPALSIYRRMPN